MNTDDFRAELIAQLGAAEQRGLPYIDINSGELHRKLGGYPGHDHRMPMCCEAMYQERGAGDEIMSAPPKGHGASVTIRYKLPR